MAAEQVERRLAAILAADVVGYSRLMERDEAGTFARLKAIRKELVEPVLARHGGRFVDLKGDGAIVEFQSAVAAVEAAVEIQRAMLDRDADLPEGERVRYRIGINLGEVIVDGGTIYGDGVNVAARIEALCEPGGVWLSRGVYNQVRGKLDFPLVPSGLHQVKNISEAVETFRVALDGVAPGPPARRSAVAGAGARRWPLPAAAALLALVLLGSAWWSWPRGPGEPARGAMPDRPSLAVLAFDNFSSDPEQGYLADGIAEDVITELARNRDLVVMARNTSFSFKGQGKTAQQVARELGVRYVLEGSVRRTGERVAVNAQLVDGRDGRHVWAEHYDLAASDVHRAQGELVAKIAGVLFSEVRETEKAASLRRPPESLDVYALTLRGLAHKHHQTKDSFLAGRAVLERAVQLDPDYAPARVYLGYLNAIDAANAVTGVVPLAGLPAAVAEVRRGIDLDPNLPLGYQALCFALPIAGQIDEGLRAGERSVALGPGDAENLAMLARAQTSAGRHADGLATIERALTLNPVTPIYYLGAQARVLYALARHEDARRVAVDCVNKNPAYSTCRLFAAASAVALGQRSEAREEVAQLLRSRPKSTIALANAANGFPRDPTLNAMFLDQLGDAGLP